MGRLALKVHDGLRLAAPFLLAASVLGVAIVLIGGVLGWTPRCRPSSFQDPCYQAVQQWEKVGIFGITAGVTMFVAALGHYLGRALGGRADRKVRKVHSGFVTEARGWVAAGRLPAKSLQDFQEAIERAWHGKTASRSLAAAASSLLLAGFFATIPAVVAGSELIESSIYERADPWMAPAGAAFFAAAGFGAFCFVFGVILVPRASREHRRESAALERHATELAGEAAEVPAPAKPKKRPVLVAPGARRPD
jgi:hypothetical protein